MISTKLILSVVNESRRDVQLIAKIYILTFFTCLREQDGMVEENLWIIPKKSLALSFYHKTLTLFFTNNP